MLCNVRSGICINVVLHTPPFLLFLKRTSDLKSLDIFCIPHEITYSNVCLYLFPCILLKGPFLAKILFIHKITKRKKENKYYPKVLY